MQPVVIIPHIISHQDTQQFYNLLQKFKADKKIIREIITTSAVLVGVQGGAANMIIVPSCYLEFETTQEEAKLFRIGQTLIT